MLTTVALVGGALLVAFYVYVLGKIFAAGWVQGLKTLLKREDDKEGRADGKREE